MSMWEELRRRKVVKVAIAYAIVGWVLVQVAATFFPALQLPGWTVTLVAALVILGFPIALVFTWVMAYLAVGDLDRVAELLETAIAKARRHEMDQGFWNLMNIKMNATADPVLEEPRFVELLARLRGD